MDLANWRRRTRLSARAARDVGGEPRQAPPSRTVWPRPRRQPLRILTQLVASAVIYLFSNTTSHS
ncbi:hypothetical protein GQ607_010143 [Colletotrichum asianum]|uniref:Uncharacterized protein n=1 Tax=Colletotrichum asianum TaxID=702518 RepID=A0A8H3WBI4_9PEZI|nr:hypothetical protein GQ607_010143 [Colletotrichum asianum]